MIDLRLESQRVHRGAHNQSLIGDRTLLVTHVHAWVVLFIIQIADLLVFNNSHHFPGNLRPQHGFTGYDLLNQNAFADRVRIRKVFPHHRFIDDRCRRCPFDITLIQSASLLEGHSESSEIRRANHLKEACLAIRTIYDRFVGDLKWHAVAPTLHRQG